jgi:hypothetical protein
LIASRLNAASNLRRSLIAVCSLFFIWVHSSPYSHSVNSKQAHDLIFDLSLGT